VKGVRGASDVSSVFCVFAREVDVFEEVHDIIKHVPESNKRERAVDKRNMKKNSFG
jgi:hypothetical protein